MYASLAVQRELVSTQQAAWEAEERMRAERQVADMEMELRAQQEAARLQAQVRMLLHEFGYPRHGHVHG